MAQSIPETENNRPSKRLRRQRTRDQTQSISPLTRGDRKKAADLIRDICSAGNIDRDGMEQLGELQRMLVLNIKAELQAVDNFGDMTEWLNERLPP